MVYAHSNPDVESSTISQRERDAFTAAVEKHINSDTPVLLESSSSMSRSDFKACFALIAQTSSAAYKASSRGWSPAGKQAEMRHDAMRYILAREQATGANAEKDQQRIAGFLSYMLTEEDDFYAVYVYEVHVSPALQGQGIGASLVRVAEAVGAATGMKRAMLTVFTSNESALRFYRRLGYYEWDAEPLTSKELRSGTKKSKPTYLILAKDL